MLWVWIHHSLDDVELVDEKTAENRAIFIDAFRLWVQAKGLKVPLEELIAAPLILSRLLRIYGKALFAAEVPMYKYVETLNGLARKYTNLR